MRRYISQGFILLLVALLLCACEQKPLTVAEVSEAFWLAVVSDKPGDVVAHSTLPSKESYDQFDREWQDLSPVIGQIVINGKYARVDTQVSKADAQPMEILHVVTYLVNTEQGWKVDYQRTADAVRASGTVVDFFGRVTSIGQEVQRQLEASSETAATQLTAFVAQLEQVAGEYQRQTGKAVDDAAARMRGLLEEFARSLEEAIDELDKSDDTGNGATGAGSTEIKESVEALQSSSDALNDPSIESIAGTAQQLIAVMEKLARISDQKLQRYTQRWEQLAKEFRAELVNLVAVFSGANLQENEAQQQATPAKP